MITIISIFEDNRNLLVKMRVGDEFSILLYGNLTKKEFLDNQHLVGYEQVFRHVKFEPIAKFCGDLWGWEMGKLAMAIDTEKVIKESHS